MSQRLPPVFVTVSDHRRLTAAALHALLETPRLAAALLDELERADVVPDHALGRDIARLGSWVEYLEGAGGAPRRAQLTARPVGEPGRPDILPVLSVAGAGLIGLRQGQTIRWPDRRGSEVSLTLLKVEPGEADPPRS